jgi:hypothetical protein
MKYIVTAISIDPIEEVVTSQPRTEEIDTETNELFRGADGPWAVEDMYEAFWNRLNASWEDDFPFGKEKVKVISVVQA